MEKGKLRPEEFLRPAAKVTDCVRSVTSSRKGGVQLQWEAISDSMGDLAKGLPFDVERGLGGAIAGAREVVTDVFETRLEAVAFVELQG